MTRFLQMILAVALAELALCWAVPTGGWGAESESYSSLSASAPLLLSSVSYEKEPEIIAYPQYAFKYGVEDPKTGDYKDQAEERDGDVVKGEYSLLQPDGRRRVVKYESDKKNGFNAIVSYSGHAIHPEQVKLVKLSSY